MNNPGRLTDKQKDLYARNILVPGIGEAGQLELLKSSVLVVGAGGLGSPALLYLAAAGIGRIGIADGDKVEVSNLQRQILHRARDVGRQKTESAQETLLAIRPDLEIELFPFRMDGDNARKAFSRFDFIVDASDSFQSKLLVNDTCVDTGRPFSHAGIRELYGQVMTVLPGKSPCVRCVFPEIPKGEEEGAAGGNGVLGCVAGVIGAIQAAEAVKYLLGMEGLLAGRILTFNAATMRFRSVDLPPEKRCEICRAA